MLPELISNDICSLRPGEDKLCFSAVWKSLTKRPRCRMSGSGGLSTSSRRRFSYGEAQLVIDTGEGEVKDQLLLVHDLCKLNQNDLLTALFFV
ncbi:MAG: RNB domain-containing ribonuclease [Bacteroidales bacterium]|nr:RNB domain-containing ribonuclease [Bacteroidales bacterium]